MHWEKVYIVLGVDKVERALLAGPVKTISEARELASDKVRSDPQWRRAFVLEAPIGYDFHLSPDAAGGAVQESVRRKNFPEVPPMVGPPEKAADLEDDDTPAKPVIYRRKKAPDTWHFVPACSNWPTQGPDVLERDTKPKTGEL